jgi:hypothetical protein
MNFPTDLTFGASWCGFADSMTKVISTITVDNNIPKELLSQSPCGSKRSVLKRGSDRHYWRSLP